MNHLGKAQCGWLEGRSCGSFLNPLPGVGKCLYSFFLSTDALSISITVHHASSQIRASFSHLCSKHITVLRAWSILERKLCKAKAPWSTEGPCWDLGKHCFRSTGLGPLRVQWMACEAMKVVFIECRCRMCHDSATDVHRTLGTSLHFCQLHSWNFVRRECHLGGWMLPLSLVLYRFNFSGKMEVEGQSLESVIGFASSSGRSDFGKATWCFWEIMCHFKNRNRVSVIWRCFICLA